MLNHRICALILLSLIALCPVRSHAGAIALASAGSSVVPKFGIVVGYKTVAEAEKAAINKCTANGGVNCRVVERFERCGAIAASDVAFGIGVGNSGRLARNKALSVCGSVECRVLDNACEDY